MRGCLRCGGDLWLDEDDCYVCMQCSRVAPDEAALLALAHLDLRIAALQREQRVV
jgi:hypothetical protein